MVKKGKEVGSVGVLGSLLVFVGWITAILVSLAVGFGMVDGVLTVPLVHELVTMVAGWIVVVLVLLSVVLKLLDRASR